MTHSSIALEFGGFINFERPLFMAIMYFSFLGEKNHIINLILPSIVKLAYSIK